MAGTLALVYYGTLLLSLILCMIQEHWLFAKQIGLLNFDHAFTSCGVSGMDDGVLLKGRPFGGCGFIFYIFLHNIKIIKTHFKHFCAILL